MVVRLGVAVGRGRGYGESVGEWRVRRTAMFRVRGNGRARVKADATGIIPCPRATLAADLGEGVGGVRDEQAGLAHGAVADDHALDVLHHRHG